MVRRRNLLAPGILTLAVVLGLPSGVRADPFQLSIAAPSFLIPLAGRNGTLTVYSDGRAPQTGCAPGPVATNCFNALGTQTFTLAGNSTSTGNLTLNLFFTGFPLGSPGQSVTDALIQFTVRDFDFITDHVTQRITLNEMAILNGVNGTPLSSPINLASYLPAGARTDDTTVTLRPIDLIPPLSGGDFTDPFILSLRLTATARNTGSQAVMLTNTPEGIFSAINLTGEAIPRKVPEPSSMLLLGLGLVCGYRKHRNGGF